MIFVVEPSDLALKSLFWTVKPWFSPILDRKFSILASNHIPNHLCNSRPKKMRTDYHQSFVASSSSSSTTSISENGRYVQQQQQQTTTIVTTQQQPPSQQREESAYARQVRLLKAGAQQPVPLMSLPPPPLPPQQLQHLQQMQSQPPPQQSEYQKMCMALDKTRYVGSWKLTDLLDFKNVQYKNWDFVSKFY